MVRFFIGRVESVDKSVHTIEFSINDFAGSGIRITAIPLSPIVILPEVGNEVLILQPNSDIEVFYYTQMPSPGKTEEQIEIKFGNSNIVLKDGEVLINGHLKVK